MRTPAGAASAAAPLLKSLAGSALWLALGALVACDSTTNNILCSVTNLPPRAATLSVLATLNGKPAMSPMDLTSPLDRFGVTLPQEASGHLTLNVTALDSDRCTQGSAMTTADLPTLRIDTPLTLAIAGQSPRRCGALAPCPTGTLCALTSLPQKNLITGLWALSPSDIWGVGWNGTIVHFDGAAWNVVPSGVATDLNAVWASSASDVWAAGVGGSILHYTGSKWTLMSNSQIIYPLYALWGTSPTNIWTVGSNSGINQTPGEFWHWDGTAWSRVVTGFNGPLFGVWASSPTDLFACGASGQILHYNGAWSTMSSGTSSFLAALWGSGPSQVFAVGDSGTILRYDGMTWKAVPSGTLQFLNGIYSDGATLYIAGDGGTLLRSAAPFTSFQAYPTGSIKDLYSAVPGSNGISWVAGLNGFLGYLDSRP